MVKQNNTYRKHTIEKVGHGKRALFKTSINEKDFFAVTESEVKRAVDTWIDEGVEPEDQTEYK